MLQVITVATLLVIVSQPTRLVVNGATCDSIDVTDPTPLRDSTGWVSQVAGAGDRRQGHISAEVVAWDQEHIVVYGGTNVRNDDVNDVVARGSEVSILNTSNPQNWTDLEMVGKSGVTLTSIKQICSPESVFNSTLLNSKGLAVLWLVSRLIDVALCL